MMVPTLVLISMLVFTIIELPPGDYFESYVAELQAMGETADTAEIDELRHRYGFDQPEPIRYLRWVGGMLVGDFGYSFEYRLPVSEVVGDRLWLTVLVSLRHHHRHLDDRLSHRHLFGDASIQLGRLRPDVAGADRPGDPEFHAGAGPDVFRQPIGSASRSAI